MDPTPHIATLRERAVCVVPHKGPVERIDDTRRPLYRHMILHELVGGPAIIRFLDVPVGEHQVDALVVTHTGFDGDEVCTVEHLRGGEYALLDYEGTEEGLPAARQTILSWIRKHHRAPAGAILQVHIMDPMDGILEAQLQVPLQ